MRVKVKGGIYHVRFPKERFYTYRLSLNGITYKLNDVLFQNVKELRSGSPVEVFPGIYITDRSGFCLRYNNIWRRVLDLLRTHIGYRFSFEFRNKWHEYTFPEIFEYQPISPTEAPPLLPPGRYDTDIDPTLCIVKTVGSGRTFCEVYGLYTDLFELHQLDGDYALIPFEVFLSNVTRHQRLLGICKSQAHCMELLRKLQSGEYVTLRNGGYEDPATGDKDICVGYSQQRYIVSTGKHRVCVSKRFGVTQIPVHLVVLSPKNNKDVDVVGITYCPCREVMDKHRQAVERLGLTEDDWHELLATAPDDIDLIAFLERKRGMDICAIWCEIVQMADSARE